MIRKLILSLAAVILQTSLAFAAPGPRLEISPQSWDFGKVTAVNELTYDFKVKNTGDDTLEIKHLITSCECTKASLPVYKLHPGEETQLTVSLDVTEIKIQGKTIRDVFVESNDPENNFKTIKVSLELDIKPEEK